MKRLISILLSSEFGTFKKADVNDSGKFYVTYNTIPKPTLLGILGAIIGLGGYSQQKKDELYPEFYEKLKELPIGITPISRNGLFMKRFIEYTNTVGYANKRAIFMSKEQTLINPAYRIYLLLDLESEIESRLFEYLRDSKATYLPYMGKNEFPITMSEFEELEYEDIKELDVQINTIFPSRLKSAIKVQKAKFDIFEDEEIDFFYLFENLPIGFDELMQYRSEEITFTNAKVKIKPEFDNLSLLDTKKGVLCLF